MLRLGRTRLYTRRDRMILAGAIGVALLGALAATAIGAAVVSWLAGHGWALPRVALRPLVSGGPGGLLGPPQGGSTPPGRHLQVPIAVSWPSSPLWSTVTAVPLWVAWWIVAVRPMMAGLRRDVRHLGLASLRQIRRVLGARRVRAAGRFTLPGTSRFTRWLLPTGAFGFYLGYPRAPRHRRRLGVWADWEQRCRLIARTGWGKTTRVLIPRVRAAPGAALVSSTEPAIFTHTVTARQHRRRPLRWRWLTLLCRLWLPLVEYPVAVVDFSAPTVRFAAGYPSVRFNPINGSDDFAVAHRQAAALVAGVEAAAASDRGTPHDQFFRDSATEVLAAWLHAAALGEQEIDDLERWLRRTDDPTPRRILRDDPRADPSAVANLAKHLDTRAERTTSGVERYLALAMTSLLTTEGRALCGHRFHHGQPVPQFDLTDFILRGGTVYLLADSSRIDRSRPLLSLFASEWFLAAERAALRQPHGRLPLPCIGFLDELRYGVTVSNLPYVASALRKYNIGYLYSVQSSTQEDVVYGEDAQALAAAAGVTIVGGIDIAMARELTERAGVTPVVSATRGSQEPGEHIQLQDALSVRDQQDLADGDAVIFARGLAPFIAYLPSIHDHRFGERRITEEADAVSHRVAVARAGDLAEREHRAAAAAAGARFDQRS